MADPQDDVLDLVRRARVGDDRAKEKLREHFGPRIYGYFYYHLNGSEREAENLAERALATALASLPMFEAEAQPFAAWLFRIANRYLAHRAEYARWAAARRAAQPAPTHAGDLPTIGPSLTLETLTQAMAELTHEQRQAILLRFVESLGTREAALAMDTTENEVKHLQATGLRRLRAVLDTMRGAGDPGM